MKRYLVFFLSFVLLFGLIGTTYAESGSGSDGDSDDDSDSDDNDSDSEVEDESDDDSNSGSDDDDSNSGSSDKEKFKAKMKDGEMEFEYESKVNGVKTKIKFKEKINSDGEVENEFEYKDKSNGVHKVKTKLRIKNAADDAGLTVGEFLRVLMADGTEFPVLVSPEEVRIKIKEKIGSSDGEMELKEKIHKNVPRVVYNINTDKNNGRFLGIFRAKMKIRTEIDAETGEILGISKPWWAWMVNGEEADDGSEVEPDEEPVACTDDAKVCDDGSSVGRVAPDCEFAACPGEVAA